MADAVGWIKIFREIQNNWVWSDKPFSKGQAWIDLIILAKRTDEKFMSGGRMINGKRGCVYKSILYLSDRWGWDRKKTSRFLSGLEADKMITVKATTHGTTIRIEKYDDFQGKGTTKGTTNGQQKGQQKDNKTVSRECPGRDREMSAKRPKYGTTKPVEISSVSGDSMPTDGQQMGNKGTADVQPLPTYKKIKKNTSYSKEDEEGTAGSGAQAPSPASREKSIYERMRE